MATKSLLIVNKLFNNAIRNSFAFTQRGFNKKVRITSIELRERQKKYLESLTQEEYDDLFRRSKFLEWNYSSEVFAFGKRLQENFTPELLVQAFTHRSYVSEQQEKFKEAGLNNSNLILNDNHELALEGEKIISNFVPRYVSYFFPRFPLEGIQSVHDYLLSEEVLAYVSKNLGTTFLILSKDYPVEPQTYSITLKALIGALCQCSGLHRANIFVRDFLITQLADKDIMDFLKVDNSLQVLNDILKRQNREPSEARIICQSATNTILANYHVGLYSNKELVGHCSGESVEIATEMAANDALRRFFHTTISCSPITYDLEEVPATVKNLSLNEWNPAAFEDSAINEASELSC